MKPLQKGLAVAFIHILLVLSVGGKLLYDRATRPRVWVRTGSVDPDLPIRGRYFTLSLEVRAADFKPVDRSNPVFKTQPQTYDPGYVELAVENNELVAHKTDRPTGMMINSWGRQPSRGPDVFFLSSPVLFFIPEHAETPRLGSGAELWAEVTVPKKGPPRPIQLAIKRGVQWTPLTYK
jgi:hypothetical protein